MAAQSGDGQPACEVRPQVVGVATAGGGAPEASPQQQQRRREGSPYCRRSSPDQLVAVMQQAVTATAYEETCRDRWDGDEAAFLEQEALTPQESLWALILLGFSSFDLLASGCLAGFAFAYAWRDEGVSLYCLGIQAVSHLASSLVMVMRFMWEILPAREDTTGVSDGCLLREQRRRDLHREQAFAITMGLAMMVSCTGLLFKAFRKIRFWDVWYLDHAAQDEEIIRVSELMAWWGFAGYFVQALLRFLGARRLRRSIVWHAFAVSVVSLIFFFVIGLAASYQKEWSWKAEPVAAMVLVFVMLCESIRMVINHLGDVDSQLGQSPHL